MSLTIPDASGQTTMTEVHNQLKSLPPSRGRDVLLHLAAQSEGSITTFRVEIEQWYDEQMDRVSGWYKRHVRWISVIIGVVVVLAFNLNTVTIARSLYADEALRGSVVAQATAAAECGTKEPADCIAELRKEISGVRSAGLPVGWGVVPACAGSETKLSTCSWPEALGLVDPASDGGADQTFFLVRQPHFVTFTEQPPRPEQGRQRNVTL